MKKRRKATENNFSADGPPKILLPSRMAYWRPPDRQDICRKSIATCHQKKIPDHADKAAAMGCRELTEKGKGAGRCFL
jgi:hypothetical protein